ncbi:hypothetical protein HK101_004934 [Irineochytrium annulatum]|nr:hypothetical protein HK101_004934 [Irineochytrium annulatum]
MEYQQAPLGSPSAASYSQMSPQMSPAARSHGNGDGYPFPQMTPGPAGVPPSPSTVSFPARTASMDMHLIQQADTNMNSLVSMVSDLGGWKPVLTHKSGAVVYRRTRVPRNETIPIFMGVGVIKGDEWYQEGRLVETIDESTSLSYMVIRAISKAIASHRDLALLERKEIDPVTGTIRVVSSSVETPKIPKVPTRVRANLKLNGWILDPQISGDGKISTRISYIIQSDVKGMIPSGLAKRYMARRALVVVWMDEYLRKYGSPPIHSNRTSLVPTSPSMSISTNDYSMARSQRTYESLNFERRPSEDFGDGYAAREPYNSDSIEVDEDQTGYNSDDDEMFSAVGVPDPSPPRYHQPMSPTSPPVLYAKPRDRMESNRPGPHGAGYDRRPSNDQFRRPSVEHDRDGYRRPSVDVPAIPDQYRRPSVEHLGPTSGADAHRRPSVEQRRPVDQYQQPRRISPEGSYNAPSTGSPRSPVVDNLSYHQPNGSHATSLRSSPTDRAITEFSVAAATTSIAGGAIPSTASSTPEFTANGQFEYSDDESELKGLESSVEALRDESLKAAPEPAALAARAAAPVVPAPILPVSVPLPAQGPHRHAEASKKAMALLRSLEGPQGWEAHSVSGNITITTRPVDGAAMPIVRGDGVIEGPWSVMEVMAVVKSVQARETWDARFEGGKILETFNFDEALTYTMQRGTFPVAGRDLVTSTLTEFDDGFHHGVDGGSVYQIATSVVDGKAPEDAKRVRAHLTVAGWIFKRVANGVHCTYIVQVDIKGSVSSSLLKMLQASTPRCIAEVQKYLQTTGSLPFVVRHADGLEPIRNISAPSETFDKAFGNYSLSLKWLQPSIYGGRVAIFLPATVYKKGIDIEVKSEKGIKVTKVVDESAAAVGSGVIVKVIAVRGAMEAGDVDLTIVAKPSQMDGVWFKGLAVEKESADAVEAEVVVPKPEVAAMAKSEVRQEAPVVTPVIATAPAPVVADAKPVVEASPVAPARTGSLPAPTSPVVAKAPAVPAARYIPHRHTEAGVKALKLLKALYSDTSLWTVESEDQRGVRVSTFEVHGLAMPVIRGDTVFPPEWSNDDIVAAVRNVGARKIWDQRFEDAQIKEWLNPNEFVFQAWLKTMGPMVSRDIAGLHVSIFDAAHATNYVISTSIVDPLVPVDPRRVRADLGVAGWIIKPSNVPRGGASVTYICKIDPKNAVTAGAFPKIQAYQMALQVAEVLSYLETYGVPLGAKVLGNTNEGLKITLLDERFDHPSVTLFLDYFVSATAVPATVNGKVASGVAGMIEITIDPRMCPGGVDASFEHPDARSAIEVRMSPDRRFLRLYPRTEVVQALGEVRVKIMIRARDPAGTKEFTLENDPNGVIIDRTNKVAANGVRKAAVVPAPVAVPVSKAAVKAPIRSPTVEQQRLVPVEAPPAGPVTAARNLAAAVEAKAAASAVSLAPKKEEPALPAATVATPSSQATEAAQERSVPVAIMIAILSLLLHCLHPIIGGRRSDPKTPLNPMTLQSDATPGQLTGIMVSVSVATLLVLQGVLMALAPGLQGLLFIFFTPAQWATLIGVSALIVYFTAQARR